MKQKKISRIYFPKAENNSWILFFDEADAIFGKRTEVHDAHDRYANQEVSYLLQRLEEYEGLVILASNSKNNIDESFLRRFQSIIHFPVPGPAERLLIWKHAFPEKVKLGENVQLDKIAEEFELTGVEIMNVVQYCCLMALERGNNLISFRDIRQGIRKEFMKSGKLV